MVCRGLLHCVALACYVYAGGHHVSKLPYMGLVWTCRSFNGTNWVIDIVLPGHILVGHCWFRCCCCCSSSSYFCSPRIDSSINSVKQEESPFTNGLSANDLIKEASASAQVQLEKEQKDIEQSLSDIVDVQMKEIRDKICPLWTEGAADGEREAARPLYTGIAFCRSTCSRAASTETPNCNRREQGWRETKTRCQRNLNQMDLHRSMGVLLELELGSSHVHQGH